MDIGPCEGYFSINLAKRGYQVTAIEKNSDRAKVLKFFANHNRLNIPVINEDWRDYLARTREEFDAIIFLSLFHHHVIRGGLKEFEKLRLLRAKKLFFEMATRSDPRMGRFPTLGTGKIVKLVLANTGFTRWERICPSQRRGVFMFWGRGE